MVNKRNTEGKKTARALSRRELLAQGASVGAGAAMLVGTGSAMAAATGGARARGNAPAGITWDQETDVLVCGAGNGGMSAALAAAEGGAKTLLLEISIQVGGNTLMSAGNLHSNGQRTWEAYNEFSEGFHDQVLGKVYIETFWNEYIPFLQSMGAYMSRPSPDAPGPIGDWYLGKGEPGQLRHKLYFDSLVKAYQARGGSILLQTRVRKLLTDEEGNVFGVRAQVWEKHPREKNQKWISIKAKKVILAIGGWIMDGERKARYLARKATVPGIVVGPSLPARAWTWLTRRVLPSAKSDGRPLHPSSHASQRSRRLVPIWTECSISGEGFLRRNGLNPMIGGALALRLGWRLAPMPMAECW